ncbi:dimethylaniline monooxygenase [N-oxide-forming] 2-like [Babylonia areolata]|uniref:dimethylaniline monooxygenase [N-oxide-forming] 2-like n=1 Tax=Babylonia areolata TaxID=304850 RepID=UPI003FD55B2F
MTEQRRRRVAIVGCGVAGLTSIKACLEEGLEPHCFEFKSDVGGLWNSESTARTALPGARMYDSLVTIFCKSMICFSDFPAPAHYPPFMPHWLYRRYIHSYAQHFKLAQFVSFNTKVLDVRQADDYKDTGRWVVTTCEMEEDDTESAEKTSEIYDGVILCQGFFSLPFIPDIPGTDTGHHVRVTHVRSYKNPQPYEGRTVLIVGCANSAGDVASDIAPVAKQVYLSVRRGAHVIHRLPDGLRPWDFMLTRLWLRYLPSKFFHRQLTRSATRTLSPLASDLQPQASLLDGKAVYMINDLLPSKIFTGQVKVVCEVDNVTGTGEVHLKDGQVLKEVDDVLFATGYRPNFRFISPSVLTSDPKSGRLDLYKMMFPLSLPHDSLAVVGCLSSLGSLAPVNELQARLAARVMAGRHRLADSREARQQDVDRTNQAQRETHGRYKYMFYALLYADSIAKELGVAPDWWRLLLRGDVKMALAVVFGPAYPFHYRLLGPHAWPGAREATEKAYRETVYSFQHREVKEGVKEAARRTENSWGHRSLGFLVFVVPVLLAYVCRFWP